VLGEAPPVLVAEDRDDQISLPCSVCADRTSLYDDITTNIIRELEADRVAASPKAVAIFVSR